MFRRLNKKQKDQAGFTLIELLVVIAIIGLISSIAMTSLSSARKRGRDAKRIGDIRQINTAIQLYINEPSIGHAPYVGAYNCSATGGCTAVAETDSVGWAILQTELSPYISRLPKDPCGAGCYQASTRKFFAYSYHPPSTIKSLCNNTPGCNLSNAQLNQMYNIFAESMEVSSPNFTKLNDGYPTYGIMGHTINSTSF